MSGDFPIDDPLTITAGRDDGATWLLRFHSGDRSVMEACYREHFVTVGRAIGLTLAGADRETVIHEVFFRLISNESLRRGFHGGSFAAWLSTVARNHAIDYHRHHARERPAGVDLATEPDDAGARQIEQKAEARLLLERFCRDHLPAKWRPVFEARFVRQLTQRDAAKTLRVHRTTLAYQEIQIRRLLQRFVLRGSQP